MNRDEFEIFCNIINIWDKDSRDQEYAKGWKNIDYQMCLDVLKKQRVSAYIPKKLNEDELKERISKISIGEPLRINIADKQYKEDQDDYAPPQLKTELVKIFTHPWVLCTLLYFFVVTLLLCFPDSLPVLLPSLPNWGWLPSWGWLVIGWLVILSFLISVYLVKMFFIATITVTRDLFWEETGQLLWEEHYIKGILMLVVTFFITLFIWFIYLAWPFTSGGKETS